MANHLLSVAETTHSQQRRAREGEKGGTGDGDTVRGYDVFLKG